MLTEKRYDMILRLLNEKRSVTVTELTEHLNASESTIRRDLNALDQAGKLVKVFGGAVAMEMSLLSEEPSVEQKMDVNMDQKRLIARFAATLIEAGDFIYLDAGTTTGLMIEFINEKNITIVTNAVDHAKRLAMRGIRVLLIGGELKNTTEAIVGNQAILNIQSYHFNKGFFGTNGASKKEGFTTPDYNEALVKKTALEACYKKYILCDSEKLDKVSSVTFAPIDVGTILTEQVPKGLLEKSKNYIVVDKLLRTLS
ncbi:DeoR/GlpR family DNA-binding transcription regulator [Lachnospiraceae bacterium OttesenSCG-928-E19]|nr:DeoR/GlpR family DNA-binding transcription regulator [Lachnospiraceae bacterium OttesenSCG-928-E19]